MNQITKCAFTAVALFVSAIAPAATTEPGAAPLAGGLWEVAEAADRGVSAAAMPIRSPFIVTDDSGRVAVELQCNHWDDDLKKSLEAAGLEFVNFFPRWAMAGGWIAPERLRELSRVSGVANINPPYGCMTNTGSVLGQHDATMNAPQARTTFSVDGTGIKVGVISDSFFDIIGGTLNGTTLTGSSSQNSGDLPATVEILDNGPGGLTDEGAAMAELIYDTAPGCQISYHTAYAPSPGIDGKPIFAQGIIDLADAGCDVIVDDVIYFDEPMFQDGIIAQAVDEVVARGIPYFSAAGNLGRIGALDLYRDASPGVDTPDQVDNSDLHDWTGAGQLFAGLFLPAGSNVRIVLNWAEPFSGVLGPGSQSDLNIYLVEFGGAVITGSSDPQGTLGAPAGNPFEQIVYSTASDQQVYLALDHAHGGEDSMAFRVAVHGIGGVTADPAVFNNSQIFGHAAAAGASAVAAVNYYEIVLNGDVDEVPGRIDVAPFSSLGGLIPFRFGPTGQELPGAPVLRYKPDICAPQDANTTFFIAGNDPENDGIPNFSGTSAAAPATAAVAALMLDRAADLGTTLTPTQVYDALNSTAIDMQTPGRDFLAGWGRVNAEAAVAAVTGGNPPVDDYINFLITGTGQEPPNLNGTPGIDVGDVVTRVNQSHAVP